MYNQTIADQQALAASFYPETHPAHPAAKAKAAADAHAARIAKIRDDRFSDTRERYAAIIRNEVLTDRDYQTLEPILTHLDLPESAIEQHRAAIADVTKLESEMESEPAGDEIAAHRKAVENVLQQGRDAAIKIFAEALAELKGGELRCALRSPYPEFRAGRFPGVDHHLNRAGSEADSVIIDSEYKATQLHNPAEIVRRNQSRRQKIHEIKAANLLAFRETL